MAASSTSRFLQDIRNRANVPEKFVLPEGQHRATIVWPHDKKDFFFNSIQFVKILYLKNVKWICPTVDVPLPTASKPEADCLAEFVADLLSREPENVIKGVGGFGLCAAVALHCATKCALGQYPINPRVVVGISGWLFTAGSIKKSIETTVGAKARAASQSTNTGTDDRVVSYERGEEVVVSLEEAGFGDVTLVPSGHEISLNVMNEVKDWLENKLQLG